MGGKIGRTLAAAIAALAVSVVMTGAASAAESAPSAPAAQTAPARSAATPVADELDGIWCASLKSCLAVGSNLNVPTPLAQTWNGSAWKTVAVKLPAKVSQGQLLQLTCLSAKDCVAVGDYVTGGSVQHALADTWTGAGWKVATPPAAAGQTTGLIGISCPSATNCVAVGSYTVGTAANPESVALADILTGTTWTRKAVPVPKGTLLSALIGVSCPAARFCVAVGDAFSASSASALIDVWNGKTWSLVKSAPVPSGIQGPSLNGVSCVSVKSCVAVGFGAIGGGLGAISETWNGKAWSYAKVSWPKGVTNTQLRGVACASATHCVAVGSTGQDPNLEGLTSRAAALTWNGKAWSPLSVPAPAKGRFSLFTGVYCQRAFCAAAGQTGPSGSTNGTGLAGFSTASSWKLVAAK